MAFGFGWEMWCLGVENGESLFAEIRGGESMEVRV